MPVQALANQTACLCIRGREIHVIGCWSSFRHAHRQASTHATVWTLREGCCFSVSWLSCLSSYFRCLCRGGPCRLLAARRRAAKETEGRYGGEVRPACWYVIISTPSWYKITHIMSYLAGLAWTVRWKMTSAGKQASWHSSHTFEKRKLAKSLIFHPFNCRSEEEDQQVKIRCFRYFYFYIKWLFAKVFCGLDWCYLQCNVRACSFVLY